MEFKSSGAMRLVTLALLLLAPGVACAEPSASMGHIPFLWGITVLGALLVACVPFVAARRWAFLQTGPRKWAMAIILFMLFLVFLSPIIVGLGSILITGRTM
jgi:hypothetical protein